MPANGRWDLNSAFKGLIQSTCSHLISLSHSNIILTSTITFSKESVQLRNSVKITCTSIYSPRVCITCSNHFILVHINIFYVNILGVESSSCNFLYPPVIFCFIWPNFLYLIVPSVSSLNCKTLSWDL